jgi:hypothetical protein
MAMREQQRSRYGLLIGEINGQAARDHLLARFLLQAGFVETSLGMQMRRKDRGNEPAPEQDEAALEEEVEDDVGA